MGFPKIWVYLLGVPFNKDSSILESIWGSPYLGKLPFGLLLSRASWSAIA